MLHVGRVNVSFFFREEEEKGEGTDVCLDRLSEAEEKVKFLHTCEWFKH